MEQVIVKNEATESSLYERQMALFRQLLAEDWETAIQICGMWHIHGLTPEEKMQLFEKFGFTPCQAQEFYDLGVRAALNNNFKDAEKYFKLALENNPQFTEAIYNLALTYEHLGNLKKSLELWELYLDKVGPNHPDHPVVKSHIRTLKKKES